MTLSISAIPLTQSAKSKTVPIKIVNQETFDSWQKKQPSYIQNTIKNTNFTAKPNETIILHDTRGNISCVLTSVQTPFGFYDFAYTAQHIQKNLSDNLLPDLVFQIMAHDLSKEDLEQASLSWALESYRFTRYKKSPASFPVLILDKSLDFARIQSIYESVCLTRELINIPANDLGPDELEEHAKTISKDYKAKITTIHDDALLKKNFPLIYTVGMGSNRRPRLIDITWGDKKHPALTLVGKGVCFDTGGLDLKPSQYMRLMKKDMGGAAHALALGRLIMALKLPVRLRILIAAVENSVSGDAFRPGDIIKSRKGLTVENTNTDAEGRLILADTLTYACEEKPDLLIDFATLTGSARAALGPDIPALFSNNEEIAKTLTALSFEKQDPFWAMPLWKDYKKYIESQNADLVNSAGLPGDLIYSALFLSQFLENDPNWIHLDLFAWENSGRPGRTKGGVDMGLRALLAYIEKRYVA